MESVRTKGLITIVGFALVTMVSACGGASISPSSDDWKRDWAVEDGFAITPDSEGFHLPTAIAFVPSPGKDLKDPLYFVTELRGAIKVVSKDRTVKTFAENFYRFAPERELPDIKGEIGLAGICLAPERGYVFVTFVYQDANTISRNGIVRFQTTPKTFSIEPASMLDLSKIMFEYPVATDHQVGACQVKDDLLYVGIGDAQNPSASQKQDSLLGKVLRMTLEGKPVADNPFYQNDDVNDAANYIWASGFRNPFGLEFVQDRFFVAENGDEVDRFLEIRKGENYFWNGSDWSIGTNAAFVFIPSVAPTQLDYLPSGSSIFPREYEQQFFVGAYAFGGPKAPGIIMMPYGLQQNKMLQVPRYFLRYRGETLQNIVGLAFGPDGLYFAPFYPNLQGKSVILKVSYDPAHAHPISTSRDPVTLIADKGCRSCHTLHGPSGDFVPTLDRDYMVPHVQTMLASPEYRQRLAVLERVDQEPFSNFRATRNQISSTQGIEQVRLRMRFHLLEPRFDNPASAMPNFGLSETQAAAITDYLLFKDSSTESSLRSLVMRLLPRIQYRHLALFFIVGLFAGIVVRPVIKFVVRAVVASKQP